MYRLQPDYISCEEESDIYKLVQEIVNYNLKELLLSHAEFAANSLYAAELEESVINKMSYDDIYQLYIKNKEEDAMEYMADFLPTTFHSLFHSKEKFIEFGVKKYFELLNIVCNLETSVTPDIIGEFMMAQLLDLLCEESEGLAPEEERAFEYKRFGKVETKKRDAIYEYFIGLAEELQEEDYFESSQEKVDWIMARVDHVYDMYSYAIDQDEESDGLGPIFWDEDFMLLEEHEADDTLALLSSDFGNTLGYDYDSIKGAFDSVGVVMPPIEGKIPQLNESYKSQIKKENS